MTGPASRARRATVLLLLGVALAAGILLAGCTSARNGLGTTQSDCYVAIPAATRAVHGRGHLQGVQLEPVSALRDHAPRLYRAATTAPKPPVARVCLVAFTGRFRAADLAEHLGDATGRLAVVELAYPGNRLLATLLVAHPPLPFGHSHIAFP